MGLNSIQQYVKGLLNGLSVPNQQNTVQAWVTPPTMENITGPRAYVWGATMVEKRQTMPRGPAFKHLEWTVDVYLMMVDNPQNPTLDQNFPLFVDVVMKMLRATTMPLKITDPTTGDVSQVLSIGERFEWEYPPEKGTAALRQILYQARLGAIVEEAIQA